MMVDLPVRCGLKMVAVSSSRSDGLLIPRKFSMSSYRMITAPPFR